MFIGAICHDLDHRGFNNKFMIDIGSPLAAIYSTSTMEHHHFNMTVTILQQVGIAPRIKLVLNLVHCQIKYPYNSLLFFWKLLGFRCRGQYKRHLRRTTIFLQN